MTTMNNNPLADAFTAQVTPLIERSNALLIEIQPLFDAFVKVQSLLAITSFDSVQAGEIISRLNTIDPSVQGVTRAMAQSFIDGIVSEQGIGRPDIQEKLSRLEQMKRGNHE